jgi:peptidyl-tRNA hydrolase, PTH1 family
VPDSERRLKVVAGLGNPGPRYDDTRHNVGWWLLDRLAHDFGLGPFHEEGPALRCQGEVEGHELVLLKPVTYMNRSGAALRPLAGREGFDMSEDLLVVVDDATREVGGLRFRPGGRAGGHNGLRSVEAALGTSDYGRLRIGVGRPPEGADLAAWVLSPLPAEEESQVLELFPELVDGVRSWLKEGMTEAMNRFNR